jgi:hypothetical protein
MAKKKIITNNKATDGLMRSMLALNASLISRADLLRATAKAKDIDLECDYPDSISIDDYKKMFDRNGVGCRVVKILPEESWNTPPEIYETEDVKIETEFEKSINELIKTKNLFYNLKRADILSGIGRYGVILLGIDDGKKLDQPVSGIDLKTGEGRTSGQHKLLYLKCFDESFVEINKVETDTTSPRYGYPVQYTVKFQDYASATSLMSSQVVHWTRILHLADNRCTSDIYGEPRMKCVYNNLLDLKKITGGSGEMFWKGGFPGISFETMPGLENATIDADGLREEMTNYMNGLQRYIAAEGLTAKSLSPQVADPTGHIKANLQEICIALGIPFRIFAGTEAAQLASGQDKDTWNNRVMLRRNDYLSSLVIRPFIDKSIALGILPEVKECFIWWPDLNAPTEKDRAAIGDLRTTAMTKYVAGGVDLLVPPKEYLTLVMHFTEEEAETMIAASEKGIISEQRAEAIQKPSLTGEGGDNTAPGKSQDLKPVQKRQAQKV